VPLDNLLHSFPVNTGHVYVVALFSKEATEGGCVMAVPRNCVFGENIAHNTFIIFVIRGAVIDAIVTPRRVAVSVTITIVTIPVSVAGVVGRIRILRRFVGFLWVVAPVPAPRSTQPPWKAEVADDDDFIEPVKATKPIISIKVETIKVPKAQG
jgi:hypothetical protein